MFEFNNLQWTRQPDNYIIEKERTTITTEIEAVQKVLGENIDRTYKTFNG